MLPDRLVVFTFLQFHGIRLKTLTSDGNLYFRLLAQCFSVVFPRSTVK